MSTDSIQKIKELKKQMQDEIEGGKSELAQQLSTACDTLKLLRELGVTNDIFKEQQFADSVIALSINFESGPKPKRTRKNGKKTIPEMILDVLSKETPMNTEAISEAITKKFGITPKKTSISQILPKLKKANKITSPERGFYCLV